MGIFLARRTGLAKQPNGCRASEQVFAASPTEQFQLLAQAAQIFGEAVRNAGAPRPLREDVAQARRRTMHVLVCELGLDFPSRGRDDSARPQPPQLRARPWSRSRVGHRLSRILRSKGANQGPRKSLRGNCALAPSHCRHGARGSWVLQPGPVDLVAVNGCILPNSQPIDRADTSLASAGVVGAPGYADHPRGSRRAARGVPSPRPSAADGEEWRVGGRRHGEAERSARREEVGGWGAEGGGTL